MRWFKAMKWFRGRRRRSSHTPLLYGSGIPATETLEERQLLSSTILFNPSGTPATPTETIGGLDFAPGNALAVSALPLSVGKTFQLDYQATLAGLISPTGIDFSPPGLNSTYQITAVASFTEVVTSLSANNSVATFALAPTQSPNSFFELYFNPAVIADNLAGTGFNSGTLILSGKLNPTIANSSNFAMALDASGNPVIQPLDLFNPSNYPGQLTVTGVGSALFNADATSFDPAFFLTPVVQFGFNTSTSVPFQTTDPSMLFVGAPGGAAPTVVPNRGAINGSTGPDFQFQADANESFTAAAPAINIVKKTNGQVALTPTGPIVAVGSTVTWSYDVTNPGNEPLKNVVVTDDNGTPGNPADDFHPTPVLVNGFNVGDTNRNGLLDPGEDWKYTATGTAAAGQYENRVVTTGVGNLSNTTVTSNSISHFFAAAPAINIVKLVNGQLATTPPGPTVEAGSTVTFTYEVGNPGNVPLSNVTLTDDNGTPGNPADDFHPTPVLVNGFNVGDTNHDGLLDPGEIWFYTATTTAMLGQVTNLATVTATSPNGTPVTAVAVGNYTAVCPMVTNVQRFGVHHQPNQILVTFQGPVTPAQAENLSNYHLLGLGPDGRFSREIPLISAVFNPATNSVTLTTLHQNNVHHLYEITVANPCPGGPNFTGILNRKFSLGSIIGHHGRVFTPRETFVPGVLNPAILQIRLSLANRPAELRLSTRPESSAFDPVRMTRVSHPTHGPRLGPRGSRA
jgi:hypothetical protein